MFKYFDFSNYIHTEIKNVLLLGAIALYIEFNPNCSTEKLKDTLTLMDGAENVISVRSGRDAEWTTPLFILRK